MIYSWLHTIHQGHFSPSSVKRRSNPVSSYLKCLIISHVAVMSSSVSQSEILLLLLLQKEKKADIISAEALPTARRMSADLIFHSFLVTTGRAGARTGYAWLHTSKTKCSFMQFSDKDKSFKVPCSHKCNN